MSEQAYGWMGKILHVDLTSGAVSQIATADYSQYLGGRGIASRLYWEKVTPEVGAFDPENRLILMTGPVVGTGAQAAARMCVAGKSPMAFPEAYCYGSLGGQFPAELKSAGWDGIVVDGGADAPVYLLVQDGEVALLDASGLWGKGALAVEALVAEWHGERARFVTTGVSGENRVRCAILYASLQGSVTAGFGAVMASKNLKAVVVRGTERPRAADPARMVELSRRVRELSDTCNFDTLCHIEETGRSHLLEVLGRRHCPQCALHCQKKVYRIGNDDELVGLRGCQAMEYYLPWVYGQEGEPLKTLFDATSLANDYALCTFELEMIIKWLAACHRQGVLTEDGIGLPLSGIGTREFLVSLLEAIVHRTGLGDILAEGMMRTRGLVSPEAAALFPHGVAPIGQSDMGLARAYTAHSLVYPFETRAHPLSLHETAYLTLPWKAYQKDPLSSNVTPEAFVEAAEALWGSEAAANMLSYEGKAVAARNVQNRGYLRDSLGFCDFIYPVSYSFSKHGPQ
jgi:aldehyde:ferredoxin oxidoreductase